MSTRTQKTRKTGDRGCAPPIISRPISSAKMIKAGVISDDEDVELWDGILYKMTKGELHNQIVILTAEVLRAVTPRETYHVREEKSNSDGPSSLPEPDVTVVRGEAGLALRPRPPGAGGRPWWSRLTTTTPPGLTGLSSTVVTPNGGSRSTGSSRPSGGWCSSSTRPKATAPSRTMPGHNGTPLTPRSPSSSTGARSAALRRPGYFPGRSPERRGELTARTMNRLTGWRVLSCGDPRRGRS